jgi:hypothetical protein
VGPTTHAKIMSLRRPPVDALWLTERLAELERLVTEGDTLEVVAKLTSMIREPSRADHTAPQLSGVLEPQPAPARQLP